MSSTRSIGREIGTAFAVLAIYLLTVLSPLHHARAGQLAFEQLGYTTTASSWVLCTSGGINSQDDDGTVAKCPATGIGKSDFVIPTPHASPVVVHRTALAAPLPTLRAFTPPRAIAPPAGSRAPPVLV